MIFKIKMIWVCLLLFLFIHASQGSPYKLILHPKDRGAACLDGSPAAMYIHEGTGENKNKFILHFRGGGFCGDSTLDSTL